MTSEVQRTMTSASTSDLAYVWAWLPEEVDPIVAGLLEAHPTGDGGQLITFAYGRSYLENPSAPSIYLPELPKVRGRQEPPKGLVVHGVIRDAAPDAWGQRVILRRLGHDATGDLSAYRSPLLTLLLESGSDRAGALDFQESADTYLPRTHEASLEELLDAADRIERGAPITEQLREALEAGSSMGGVRPKATIGDESRHLIAKFSSISDTYPVVKAEAAAMSLARRCGLDVAGTEVVRVSGKDVLLVERFDRLANRTRRQFVSALTILSLDEMMARYASYHDLADQIRARFARRSETLRELFSRIVLNILVGNTDDHARNHAAFWDGDRLSLTPAFDICPQRRTGQEASQAMAIAPRAGKMSQMTTCVAASGIYELSEREARDIIDHQLEVIHVEWDAAADEATLTKAERADLWGRQILNPYATYEYS